MIITSIREEDKKRAAVSLDGEFFCLLYKGELRRLALKEGMELTAEQVFLIEETILKVRARNYCMHILERQSCSEKKVMEKLLRHRYSDKIAAYAVTYWKELGYIDDLAYAGNYISCHYMSDSYRRICEKLYQRGIASETVEQAWADFSENLKEPEEEYRIALKRTIEKKSRSLNLADTDDRNRMIRYLLGRGFPYREIVRELAEG